MYFCITYISKATREMTDRELVLLLEESIRRNTNHHITGMLLYMRSDLLQHRGGRFIQALEGKEADVKAVFEKIRGDQRHFDVTKLGESFLSARNFEQWQMGFKLMDASEYFKLPGRFELDESFLDYNPADFFNPALSLLKEFYTLNNNYTDNNSYTDV